MAEAKGLSFFSEIELEQKAPKRFPVSCPTLNLSTTWDGEGGNLLILRSHGQVVSKIHQAGAPGARRSEPLVVTWKPDGQFLAVGWSDGVVRLMGLENNKAAHHITVSERPDVKITHIGCASSAITSDGTISFPNPLRNGVAKTWDLEGGDDAINLPKELTFLEVDTALPKISPLPASSAGAGEDATVFTLRSGVDFLFQTTQPSDYDKVNVMVVGTSDGKLHLSIYDCFAVGSFQCPSLGPGGVYQMMDYASHPELSTHCLVMADKPANPEKIYVVPMDLPFVTSSPINLSLLASKLTTLQKLLRYLRQTQLHMQVEWKNTRELPGRFLRSVEEDLANMPSGPRGIVPALYHTVVTGHAHGPVREWLTETLTERGHKRWDKAVVSGLEGLRSLVHENFLPALERCSIILSRLRGLAQFHDQRDDIGYSVTQIHRAMDIISCLSFVGHTILISVMDELEHFTAFSTWLRFQIDRQGASSSAGEELTEREATMNNAKVLTYIEQYLTQSPLDVFFDEIAKKDYEADWEQIKDGPILLDVLDKQLQKRGQGQPSMRALPHVEFLVNYVTVRSNRMFEDIADAMKRSVRFASAVKQSIGGPITTMDFRLSKKGEQAGYIYAALGSRDHASKVYIIRTSIGIVNGFSTTQPPTAVCIDLQAAKLIDLKFVNDQNLYILCSEADHTSVIVCVPVESPKLPYDIFDADHAGQTPRVLANRFTKFSLPAEHSMRPVSMEAHDKSETRGGMPARISLLGSNRTTLRTFTLPEPTAAEL